jgi:hypothetical protein
MTNQDWADRSVPGDGRAQPLGFEKSGISNRCCAGQTAVAATARQAR